MPPSVRVLWSRFHVEPIAELSVVWYSKDISVIDTPPNIDAVNIFTGVFNHISRYAD